MTTQRIQTAMARFRLRFATAPTHVILDQEKLAEFRRAHDLHKNPEFINGLAVIENFENVNAVAIVEPL